MLDLIFLICLGIIWLVFASVCDLKSREIPNWISFSLIIFALGFRFFYSLFLEDFNFFFMGLIGGGIFFVLANLFYYGRMFAGGDAKLLMALGVVLPFSTNFLVNIKIFLGFLFLFLFIGGFYGIVWSFILSFRNLRKFKKEFIMQFEKNKISFFLIICFCLIILLFGFWKISFFYIGIAGFLFVFLLLYAKAVEEVCMVKNVSVKKLTEGDWLYKDVRVGNKIVKSSWDGLNKKDIALIKKHKKKVLVKYGIPFVPVFLIAFLILVYFWFNGFSLWNAFF